MVFLHPLDYFIIRIKSRVRAGNIIDARERVFSGHGILIWKYVSFFFLTAVRLDLSGSGF